MIPDQFPLMIDEIGGEVGTVEEICSFEYYFCLVGELQQLLMEERQLAEVEQQN